MRRGSTTARCVADTRRADARHRQDSRSDPAPRAARKNQGTRIRSSAAPRARCRGSLGTSSPRAPATPPRPARACRAPLRQAACPVRRSARVPRRTRRSFALAVAVKLPQSFRQRLGFALALQTRIERVGFDRGAHCAAGFVAVIAIGEAAARGQCVDVGEHVQLFLAGEFQFAHAGRVDQAGAAGQQQQRAMRGGVTAAVIAGAHFARGHTRFAQQCVRQRRFAGARRADQHCRDAGLQVSIQHCNARCVLAVDRVQWHAGQTRGELRRRLPRVRGFDLVELSQHDHRLRAAAFSQREIALCARGIEVAVQAHQHEHDVDIRGDDLARIAFARGRARQCPAARQHFYDMRRRSAFDDHEIAHCRTLSRIEAAFQETRRGLSVERSCTVVHFVTGAMLRGHARETVRSGERGQLAAPTEAAGIGLQFILHRSGCYANPRPQGCYDAGLFLAVPSMQAPILPSSRLAQVRYEIRGALAQRAREIEAAGHVVLKLNIGNPGRFGFRAPAHLLDAFSSRLPDSDGYCHEQGLEEAREAIAAQQRARGAHVVDIERVFVGNGVSELIDLSLRSVLEPGDEVLLPSPDYPLWSAATILNGGVPRYYACPAARSHLPDADEIDTLCNSRTRAIVLINPNNPTGAVYPRELLAAIVEVAARRNLLLFCDEIYHGILYDDARFTPLASLTGELPCLSFGGLSKVHRVCGWRAGWLSLSGSIKRVAPLQHALQLLAALRLCANVPAQWAIAPALNGPDTISALIAPGGRLHASRQAAIASVARSEFLEMVAPRGALYAFPAVRSDALPDFDDTEFALRLLEEEHALVVPGSSFNLHNSRHFRITLLPQADVISDVFARIERMLARTAQIRARRVA